MPESRASLFLPVSFVVAERLGIEDFMLRRTFITEFDVMIDSSQGRIRIRDPGASKTLRRKESMGGFNESFELVLDGKATLASGQVTLCKLKLANAPQVLENE